jgi:DNA-directed RNA polymerase subunit RPC12/RpoP
MDNENLLIVCRSCNRKILMHNMRPDGTGENMVCNDCYKRNSPNRTMSISEVAAAQSQPIRKVVEHKEPMVKYLCTSCKYKFSRKQSQEVGKCPYCGKSSIVMDNQLGAAKLLNESNDKRFETW